MDTGSRKWGRPYLTRDFFERDRRHHGRPRAAGDGAARGHAYRRRDQLSREDAIYGRNWGAIEERPFLHFEVCYYQAIEYAIRHGFARVEAGAQGEHKLARGYRPVATYSAHDFADARFERAIKDFVEREKIAVDEQIADYQAGLPFRKGPAEPPEESDGE